MLGAIKLHCDASQPEREDFDKVFPCHQSSRNKVRCTTTNTVKWNIGPCFENFPSLIQCESNDRSSVQFRPKDPNVRHILDVIPGTSKPADITIEALAGIMAEATETWQDSTAGVGYSHWTGPVIIMPQVASAHQVEAKATISKDELSNESQSSTLNETMSNPTNKTETKPRMTKNGNVVTQPTVQPPKLVDPELIEPLGSKRSRQATRTTNVTENKRRPTPLSMYNPNSIMYPIMAREAKQEKERAAAKHKRERAAAKRMKERAIANYMKYRAAAKRRKDRTIAKYVKYRAAAKYKKVLAAAKLKISRGRRS